ncbi:hypothetical protein SLS62_007003 [Diatrype stigma]|uniref:Uncharacterized protein n=1 Tax=Diatrype stigma TaxID=117547 RepID=A0AAN9UNV3_9PEZI
MQFICCPVGLACFETEFSPSGIVCCGVDDPCDVTEDSPATCVEYTVPCKRSQGGGCCPQGTDCSPEGCVDVYLAAPGLQSTLPGTTAITTATTTTAARTVPTTGTSLLPAVPDIISALTQVSLSSSSSSSKTTKAPSVGGGGDVATTVTATKFPDAVTVTTIKFGEVAQSRCTRGVWPGLVVSQWPTLEIFTLALALGVAWIILLGES